MSRVIEVRDSRTILVETAGNPVVVALRGVIVPQGDEIVASKYLRRALDGRWVFVENGEVYRSPDGLHVNGAMRRRAWLGATYLGELVFPDATRVRTPVHALKSTPAQSPPKRAKNETPSKRRSRSSTKRPVTP